MKLFKDILIEQKIEKFEVPKLDQKIEIVKKWLNDYEHGTLKKDSEISRAPGFNQDFFLDILGYTKKPSETYSFNSEYLIEGKRPDGVLGFFKQNKIEEDNIFAVVELKGALNQLDKPQQREKNITPIEQAFGYKRHLRKCPFVIVSNFYEIRLFNDNELDYEIWNLHELVDSKNDHFNFKKFYYLLCAENFIQEQGISNTESLLSEIKTEEEEITKKFYEDYKRKRHLLLQNIYKKNEVARLNSDLLIEKGQKIIDRIIFMCFCEDRGLLPVDILQKIKTDYKKSSVFSSSWDALKSAFNSVDKGNEKWNLPDGYNGGLFRYDEVLNDLKLEDHVLMEIVDFSTYDFKNEMSVNILGHIFEQSISELEEIKTKIIENKGEIIETSNKTSKRKKEGIFYTPEYIVNYIVKNSLGSYLHENEIRILQEEKITEDLKENEYRKREQKAYTRYQEFLSKVKVLDPACGSGAFLVKVFDYLLEENQRVGKILGGLFNTDSIYKSILENNIYGVDLNQESVEITKLSLWLKSAQPGKKLNNLDNNIKCGNSLIDDPDIAGNKAFNWEKEFSEIIKEGGFNVIVGNPPYIFLRSGNMEVSEKNYFRKTYKLYNLKPRTDIYFFEKAFSLLKKNGYISFIAPNNILTVNSLKDFRKYFLEGFGNIQIINIKDKVFDDANVDTMIMVLNKESRNNNFDVFELVKGSFNKISSLDKNVFCENDFIINYEMYSNPFVVNVVNKIDRISNKLSDFVKISNGLVAYKVGNGEPKQNKEMGEKRIYHSYKKIDESWLPYIGGSDLKRYLFNWSGEYIKYGKNLGEPRKFEIFNKKHLLVRVIPSVAPYCINCSSVDKNIINDQNYVVLYDFKNDDELKYICALLNSRLISFWFINKLGKMQRGLFPQLKAGELADFPIFKFDIHKNFIEIVDRRLGLNKEFSEMKERFLERMKENYKLEKPSEKIEKFYELSFNEFVTEMRKKGAGVPLSTQDELENYFNEYKKTF